MRLAGTRLFFCTLTLACLVAAGCAEPVIESLNTNCDQVGATVIIRGEGFDNAQGSSTVTFNDVDAGDAAMWSESRINIDVPEGANSGPLVVTVGGSASNPFSFTVMYPVRYNLQMSGGFAGISWIANVFESSIYVSEHSHDPDLDGKYGVLDCEVHQDLNDFVLDESAFFDNAGIYPDGGCADAFYYHIEAEEEGGAVVTAEWDDCSPDVPEALNGIVDYFDELISGL